MAADLGVDRRACRQYYSFIALVLFDSSESVTGPIGRSSFGEIGARSHRKVQEGIESSYLGNQWRAATVGPRRETLKSTAR